MRSRSSAAGAPSRTSITSSDGSASSNRRRYSWFSTVALTSKDGVTTLAEGLGHVREMVKGCFVVAWMPKANASTSTASKRTSSASRSHMSAVRTVVLPAPGGPVKTTGRVCRSLPKRVRKPVVLATTGSRRSDRERPHGRKEGRSPGAASARRRRSGRGMSRVRRLIRRSGGQRAPTRTRGRAAPLLMPNAVTR